MNIPSVLWEVGRLRWQVPVTGMPTGHPSPLGHQRLVRVAGETMGERALIGG